MANQNKGFPGIALEWQVATDVKLSTFIQEDPEEINVVSKCSFES